MMCLPSAQYNGTSGMGVPIIDLHSVVNKATKCAGQITVLFIAPMIDSIHTYTLLPLHLFNSLFCRTTWVSHYQKGKTSLDFNEARDDGVLGWQWHQLDHMQTVCTSLQTDNHTNTSSLNFYRPDALSDANPMVSNY